MRIAVDTLVEGGSFGSSTVTSLPGSPVDGQEVILTDSLTAPTYRWRLQYESSTSKWWFLGGTPLIVEVATNEGTSSGTYTALATAGPSIALPVAGDYDVEIGFAAQGSSGGRGAMSFDIGGTGAVDADACFGGISVGGGGNAGSFARTRRLTGLTAVTLTAKYRTVDSSSPNFERRWMRVTPVKVG